MAPHSSMLSSLRTGYVPVHIKKLRLWPQHVQGTGNLRATVRGNIYGPRTLLAESFVRNVNDEPVLEIDGLRLRALDLIKSDGHGDDEPFSKFTWRPAVDLLTTKQITSLYPPKRADTSPDLDELAINQLITFRETYPELFNHGSSVPHLNKFLHWIRDKTNQILAGQDLVLTKIPHRSSSQRLEVIKELGARLKQTSSEGRIMCRMYENLPTIFEGQRTGIQVALQDNLLSDLYENGTLLREGNRRLAQVIALLSHQNPAMAVLEVGAGTGSATREILKALEGSSTRRKYREYVYTDITPSFLGHAEKQFSAHSGVTYSTFDMERTGAEQGFSRRFDLVVASNAIHATTDILTTLRNIRSLLKDNGKLVLLEITRQGPFLSKRLWQEVLPQSGYSGLDLCLDDFFDQPSSSVLVSTAVPHVDPSTSDPDVVSESLVLWENLQTCLISTESALWVTNGGLLLNRRPQFAMAEGLIRGLKTERQDLRICLLDIDLDSSQPVEAALKLMMNLERETFMPSNGQKDWQYRQGNGITHISRLVPDELMNERFRGKEARTRCTERTELLVLGHRPLQVKKAVAATDNPIFLEDRSMSSSLLRSHEVEVKVTVRGFSDETISSSSGDDGYAPHFGSFAGTVVAAGDGVDNLALGANVHGLQYSDDAFQIVRSRDAEIYFAVETAEDKQSLLEWIFDLRPENVFLSSDMASLNDILVQTQNRGIDVIFSNNITKGQQDYSSCLAYYGRLITRSHRQAYPPDVVANVVKCLGSFFVFDLAEMTLSRPNVIQELLADFQQRLQHTAIAHDGSRVSLHRLLSSIVQTSISSRRRVIDFDDPEEVIDFRESRYDTRLDPEASYILVGCLGGLGRHISKWMVSRGARNLVYLSRSSETNGAASAFLTELGREDVSTRICNGDVSRLTDIAKAVALCNRPIKGAIHAALTLRDCLYENMSFEDFNMTVKARVDGVVNLHTALETCSLDFFLTLSSWTSVIGTPTQSNYLASNSFMDAFACHRQSLGLPATSLSLSQILDVGVVNSTPKYQIALEKYGLYGNSGADFLDYCDSAISGGHGSQTHNEIQQSSSDGHLLAGVEPRGLLKLGKRIPLKESLWYGDRRFSPILHAINLLQTEHVDTADVAERLEEEDLQGAQLLQGIHKKIARLLYTPPGEIDITTPINTYGIDSMIAAELRNWLHGVLDLDIPLLTLLSPTTTINSLSELAESGHLSRGE
ncbi:MAG: hypothetical protein Q9185_004321 [Variospora sp. 1 TL-2023]